MSARSIEVRFSETGMVVTLDAHLARLAERAASRMMDAAELSHLIATVMLARLGPGDLIVEIGAYRGETTVLLHRALDHLGDGVTPILSIDPFDEVVAAVRNPRGSLRAYRRRVRGAGAGDRCFALVGYSQHTHPAVPDRIGVLVVDGDHRYPAVVSDLAHYAPKVRPGGLVFVDDYSPDSYPEVRRAVDEFAANHPEFVVLHRSWFAILQRAAPG